MVFKHTKTKQTISSFQFDRLSETEQSQYKADYSVNANEDLVMEEEDSSMDMFGGVNEFKTIDDTDAD